MNPNSIDPLIHVLKRSLAREEEKIERSRKEIWKLKMELLDLGVELPLEESANPIAANPSDGTRGER